MVANCCRFLCYFCRISRQNQKAMFDHLSYLLENSSVGLGQCVWLIFTLFLSLIHGLLTVIENKYGTKRILGFQGSNTQPHPVLLHPPTLC